MATIYFPRMSTISNSSAACATAGWPTARMSRGQQSTRKPASSRKSAMKWLPVALGSEGLSLKQSASRWLLSSGSHHWCNHQSPPQSTTPAPNHRHPSRRCHRHRRDPHPRRPPNLARRHPRCPTTTLDESSRGTIGELCVQSAREVRSAAPRALTAGPRPMVAVLVSVLVA